MEIGSPQSTSTAEILYILSMRVCGVYNFKKQILICRHAEGVQNCGMKRSDFCRQGEKKRNQSPSYCVLLPRDTKQNNTFIFRLLPVGNINIFIINNYLMVSTFLPCRENRTSVALLRVTFWGGGGGNIFFN